MRLPRAEPGGAPGALRPAASAGGGGSWRVLAGERAAGRGGRRRAGGHPGGRPAHAGAVPPREAALVPPRLPLPRRDRGSDQRAPALLRARPLPRPWRGRDRPLDRLGNRGRQSRAHRPDRRGTAASPSGLIPIETLRSHTAPEATQRLPVHFAPETSTTAGVHGSRSGVASGGGRAAGGGGASAT